jgi:SAM-dependent methyltransferase
MNALLESLLINGLTLLNLVPKPLLDTTGPVMRARIITAAAKLGVFEVLGRRAVDYQELLAAMGAEGDGLRLMLEALTSYGYVRHDGRVYRNSRMARKYLISDSPHFVGNMVLFQEHADAMTRALATIVRTGRVESNYESYMDQDAGRWRSYVTGMRESARLSVSEVLGKVSVPADATSLLDLGGSHGLYASAFCERYPRLRAVVFDRPEAVKIGRELTTGSPALGRVDFRAGDMCSDHLGEDYDVVLLFAVLHLFSPPRNLQLLKRVANAMRTGGTLVIADFLKGRLSPGWAASFSLGMRCFFGEGQAYEQTAIGRWLSETGFERIRVKHLRNPASLITAVKGPL